MTTLEIQKELVDKIVDISGRIEKRTKDGLGFGSTAQNRDIEAMENTRRSYIDTIAALTVKVNTQQNIKDMSESWKSIMLDLMGSKQ